MGFIIRFTGTARLSDSMPSLFETNTKKRRKDAILFAPGWVLSKDGPTPKVERARVFATYEAAVRCQERHLRSRARFTEIEELEIS